MTTRRHTHRRIDPEALIQAREKAGDGSKNAAAAAAGLTWLGYDNWEKGITTDRFDWNSFTALCDYLGVEPEDITVPIEVTEVGTLLLLGYLHKPITLRNLALKLKAEGRDLNADNLRAMLRELIKSGYARHEGHGRGRAVTYQRVQKQVSA